MGRSSLEKKSKASRTAPKVLSRERETRYFAAGGGKPATRAEATDRQARVIPRVTWVLNQDALEEQYVH